MSANQSNPQTPGVIALPAEELIELQGEGEQPMPPAISNHSLEDMQYMDQFDAAFNEAVINDTEEIDDIYRLSEIDALALFREALNREWKFNPTDVQLARALLDFIKVLITNNGASENTAPFVGHKFEGRKTTYTHLVTKKLRLRLPGAQSWLTLRQFLRSFPEKTISVYLRLGWETYRIPDWLERRDCKKIMKVWNYWTSQTHIQGQPLPVEPSSDSGRTVGPPVPVLAHRPSQEFY